MLRRRSQHRCACSISRALTAIALPLVMIAAARGDDWPAFLGPQGSGISAETGLLAEWPAGGPPVLWKKQVGEGYAAPAVRGDRLVFFHREGDEEVVECLDVRTGATRWRHAAPTTFTDPYGYNGGPRAAPVLSADRCITFGAEGRLTCLDLATGKLIWQRETRREFDVPAAFFGAGSTPLLDGDQVIVMVGGHPQASVVAFALATGKTRWQSIGFCTSAGSTWATLTERVRRRVVRWFRMQRLLDANAAADMLRWENSGFSVDASVRITLIDRDVPSYFKSLEHLLRYCARPPFALERLSVIRGKDGRIARVRYVLPRHKAANWVGPGRGRKTTRPGANGVDLTPFEFLDRLADHGVQLEVPQNPRCIELMREFMQKHPELWAEDIGE